MAIAVYLDTVPRHVWYEWYHFDEPWDSPFNKGIQQKCPTSYHCPSHTSELQFTDYAMLRGPGTVGGDGLTAISIQDILDGTSNTILVVEACGRKIVWTEPKDIEVTDGSLGVNLPGDQPNRSCGIVSSYHSGGAHVVMADGSVRFVGEKINKTVLKALTTIHGDEAPPGEW